MPATNNMEFRISLECSVNNGRTDLRQEQNYYPLLTPQGHTGVVSSHCSHDSVDYSFVCSHFLPKLFGQRLNDNGNEVFSFKTG